MLLSKKLRYASNFTDFEKKDDSHRLCSFEIPYCESHGKTNV